MSHCSWHGGDYVTGGDVTIAEILSFTVVTPSACALATLLWYRAFPASSFAPAFRLIFGCLGSVPLYALVASYIWYDPRPILIWEFVEDLAALYLGFPYTVLTAGTYRGTLLAFYLATGIIFVTASIARQQDPEASVTSQE